MTLPDVETWIAEANAMRDVGEQTRTVALSLPEDSRVRAKMLDSARSWLVGACLRGVESPVSDALDAEVAAGEVLAAQRLLARA